eukprot:Sspe_Gene.76903::Locus_48035_Transcript_1_1_Confidence_1.000_Length_3042::g.76903::m.76903
MLSRRPSSTVRSPSGSRRDRSEYLNALTEEVANVVDRNIVKGHLDPQDEYEPQLWNLAPDDPPTVDLRIPMKAPPPPRTSPPARGSSTRVSHAGSRRGSRVERNGSGAKTTKAVLIGVQYTGQRHENPTAIADTNRLSEAVAGMGFTAQWVLTDTDPHALPTRANVINALKWLVKGAVPGDSLFLSFSGLSGVVQDARGKDEQTAICPVDHAKEGVIGEGELSELLLTTLPEGVRLTVVSDSGYGGSFLEVPFKVWAVDSGFGCREPSDAYIRENSTGGEVLVLCGCKEGRGGPQGRIIPAFIEAVQTETRPSYKTLLQRIRAVLHRMRIPLVPQFSCSRLFDFDQTFSLIAPRHPTLPPSFSTANTPTSRQAPPSAAATPAPPSSTHDFPQSALHQAAMAGWTPGVGPPVPPPSFTELQKRHDKEWGVKDEENGVEVKVSAPQGCLIELQCHPYGERKSESPSRSPRPRVESGNTSSMAQQPSADMASHENGHDRKASLSPHTAPDSPGARASVVEGWETATRGRSAELPLDTAKEDAPEPRTSARRGRAKVKGAKKRRASSAGGQRRQKTTPERSGYSSAPERIYKYRRSKHVEKRLNDLENRAEQLRLTREREREIELERVRQYQAFQEHTRAERELEAKIEAEEELERKKAQHEMRLARHVERVHQYSKMKLSKPERLDNRVGLYPISSPRSPAHRKYPHIPLSPRLSPPPPPDPCPNSPSHRSVLKKRLEQQRVLQTMQSRTDQLLGAHMMQRRAMESQLDRLQEGNSTMTTLTSDDRSLTPHEVTATGVQTIPDPLLSVARKIAIQAAADRPFLRVSSPPFHFPPTATYPYRGEETSPSRTDQGCQTLPQPDPIMSLIRLYWRKLKQNVAFRKVQRLGGASQSRSRPSLASPSPEATRPPSPVAEPEEGEVAEAEETQPDGDQEGSWEWDEAEQKYVWVVRGEEGDGKGEGEEGSWEWNEETQEYEWKAAAKNEEEEGEWVWSEEKQ